MTELLKRAIAEIEKLPADGQDATAARFLAEAADDRAWEASFRKTTDEQWDCIAERVRQEVAAGDTMPLEDVLPADDSQPRPDAPTPHPPADHR